MALITCPNCGRKGVSNKAIWCPGCEYNIKEHFYQQRLPKLKEETLCAVEKRFHEENGAQKRISYWESSVKECRYFIKLCIWVQLGCAVLNAALCWIVSSDKGLRLFLTAPAAICGTIALIAMFYNISKSVEYKRLAEDAKADFERFSKRELRRQREEAMDDLINNHQPYRPIHKLTGHICPQCGIDVDFLENICPECGKNLVHVPAPNPIGQGDMRLMWCPYCGSKSLKRTASENGIETVLLTTCMDCKHLVDRTTYRNS
ncbi:MAG: hypothetical protein ACI4I5_02065 [Acutalibacteraceae bacterium]